MPQFLFPWLWCVLVLAFTSPQMAAQSPLDQWEHGMRATATISGHHPDDFKSADLGVSEGLADVLYSQRLLDRRQLELCRSIMVQIDDHERTPLASFLYHMVSSNLEYAEGQDAACLQASKRMLNAAEHLGDSLVLAIAELEWSLNVKQPLHGQPLAKVAADARRRLGYITQPALRNRFIARSVFLMNIPELSRTEGKSLKRAQRFFREEGLPELELQMLFNLATYCRDVGQPDSAWHWMGELRRLAALQQDDAELCNATHWAGVTLYKNKGDKQQALDSLQAAYDCLVASGNWHTAAANRFYAGMGTYYLSDAEDAGLDLFKTSMALAKKSHSEEIIFKSAGYIAYLTVAANHPDAADSVDALIHELKEFHLAYGSEDEEAAWEALRMSDLELETARGDREAAERKEADARAQSLVIGIVAAILLALALAGLWTLYARKQRDRFEAAQALHRQSELRAEEAAKEMISRHRYEKLLAGIAGEEQERERIAQELHDNIGGSLGILAAQLNSGGDVAQKDAERFSGDLNKIYRDLRSLSHTLQLPDTEQNALVELTRNLLKNLGEAGSLQTNLSVFPPDRPLLLSEQMEVQLFRVLQELCTNVLKHAEATQVEVTMTRRDDGVSVIFEDNGKGFDVGQSREGMGLSSMQNRIQAMGGTLSIDAHPERGAIFAIDIPLA